MYRSSAEVLQLLLNANCNVDAINACQETPLHLATKRHSPETLQLLLDAGSNINARDENQQTALHIASAWSNEKVVHKLLNAGADINARDENLHTPLHTAIEKGPWSKSKLPVIRVLLCHGADIFLVTQHGYDALALAIIKCTLEVVKLILDSGALVNRRYGGGRTVLMKALDHGRVGTVPGL